MITFPVAIMQGGRIACVSNAFRNPDHLGVDIMFSRRTGDPSFQPNDPRGTKGYYVPLGALVVAAMDGYVLYARWAANGYRVRLAHALEWPWQTLYLHLEDLRVKTGQLVRAGQPLGLMGGDPSQGDPRHVVHLHFEIRKHNEPHDPMSWLKNATYV